VHWLKIFLSTRRYQVPMVVDTMENYFQKAFAAWPFRFFMIKDHHIAYKAEPNPTSLCYHIQDLSTLIPSFLS